MGPNHEANHTNGHHGIGHAEITENRLLGKGGNDVADDAKAGQDQNIHFRMTEEPEQMLEQDRVTAARRIKEGGAKIAVCQQHGDAASQHGQGQNQQEGGDQHRPCKQRHTVQGHARCTHVEDGGDKIDRAQNGRSARQMQ